MAATSPPPARPLLYAHLGDLHLTDAKARNYQDLLASLAQLAVEAEGPLDFVYLPGDVADNGRAEQYRLVAAALRLVRVPVCAVPGDHDMEPGSLANFYAGLGAAPLPRAVEAGGVRCLLLDVCGSGQGGPDFRLGAAQLTWLQTQLAERPAGTEAVVLMHTYPADLRDPAERQQLLALLHQHRVALVDMGHTHYNELANDGTTLYAATRSLGQIEEGPVGYSLVALDGDVVSWRFKPLDGAFPFVLITAPADHRLLRHAGQAVQPGFGVRALVLGARAVAEVRYWLDDGPPHPMQLSEAGVWEAEVPGWAAPFATLTVEARDASGRPGRHRIWPALAPWQPPERPGPAGSDAARIGEWAENGLLDTQLGPNRNARPARQAAAS